MEKAPNAHRRLVIAKDLLTRQAERLAIPMENVLTPDHLRRICWDPVDASSAAAIDIQLRELGARTWQREIVAPLLLEAFSQASVLSDEEASA
jgi:ribonuclease D